LIALQADASQVEDAEDALDADADTKVEAVAAGVFCATSHAGAGGIDGGM
jgi:hypothetical protein